MTGALEQLDRELQSLRSAMAAIAQEALDLYEQYLKTLGQSVQQQLILTSYHVCTQVYPENFLQLSLDQRQDLQQNLQQLSQQINATLLADLSMLPSPDGEGLSALDELITAQAALEVAISETLHKASRTVNQLLQASGILPSAPLEKVLEIAAKAEAAGRSVTRTPHLLTAMIETEEDDEPEAAAVIAVYLQVGELEFTETAVMVQRNQIRQLTTRIHKLQKEMARKQRERLAVEAEAAWRSTWPGES